MCGRAENKRFVGISERLGKHGHDHGNLDGASVNTQQFLTPLPCDYLGKAYLIGYLVKYACKTQNQYGPGVRQHLTKQLSVKSVPDFKYLRQQTYSDTCRAEQIDIEYVSDYMIGIIPAKQRWVILIDFPEP